MYQWLSEIWIPLGNAIKEETGIQIPKFYPNMIRWKDLGEQFGSLNPASSVITLNEKIADDKDHIVQTLTHELIHFVSQQKILEKEVGRPRPVKGGLAVIRDIFLGKKKTDDPKGPEVPDKWSFAFIDEAVVEELSQKIFSAVSSEIPGLDQEKPTTQFYSESIRFYEALVRNIAIAWNNPALRAGYYDYSTNQNQQGWDARESENWQLRVEKLKKTLELSDQITEDDVKKIFEEASYNKGKIQNVAKLINTMLGNGVYLRLVQAEIDAAEFTGAEVEELWSIINVPAIENVKHKKDISYQLADDFTLEIPAKDIPKHFIEYSFDDSTRHVMGIREVFKKFKEIFKHPLNKNEMQALFEQNSENLPSFLKKTQDKRLLTVLIDKFTPTTDVSHFGFYALSNSLGVYGEPIAKYQKNDSSSQLEMTLEFYKTNLPNREIARIVNTGSPAIEVMYLVET